MALFDDKIPLISQAIKFSSMRHEVLSHNVANIETPNFKAKDMVFKKELNSSMERFEFKDPLSETPDYIMNANVVTQEKDKFNQDGNNTVNLDQEMSKISKNTIFNHTLIQVLNQKFKIIKSMLNST